MKTNIVKVFKAASIGRYPVDDLIIKARMPFPEEADIPIMEIEAKQLADALINTLPGGVLDRLLVRLMQNAATCLIVKRSNDSE